MVTLNDQNPYVRSTGATRTSGEILELFADNVYGHPPEGGVALHWKVVSENLLPGGSRRRQLVLKIAARGMQIALTLLVYLPASVRAESVASAVPAFLGMNFRGNHTCETDSDVLDLTEPEDSAWGDRLQYEGRREQFDVPAARGAQGHRWDFPAALARGYGIVTWSYFQVGPDSPEIFAQGPHRLFRETPASERSRSEWGSIGMWAWCMSRVLDGLEKGMVPEIDAESVIAHGHSRLGKAALWAAAYDNRFAGVISNNSGAMGAALSRPVGETPEVLARIRPHWFARRFSELILSGRRLPVDQHELIATIAPRPVYVASASNDHNADPEGEFRSWQMASAAWAGGSKETAGDFPSPGEARLPEGVPLGYHLRDGEHDVESFDWAAWLDWADQWIR